MSPEVERVFNEVSRDIAQALVEVLFDPDDRDFAADMVLLAHQAGMGRGRLEALVESRRPRPARYPDSEERP